MNGPKQDHVLFALVDLDGGAKSTGGVEMFADCERGIPMFFDPVNFIPNYRDGIIFQQIGNSIDVLKARLSTPPVGT